MSFHIQFNNVSAYNVTSPLIKKPEKDLHFKDLWRRIWKIVQTKHSTKICFIAEGYFNCPLSYLGRELILYRRVNGLRTSIVWIWSLDIKQILYVISKHLIYKWV